MKALSRSTSITAPVDVEAEDCLVLAPFQALVDAADLGAVGILEGEDGCFAATEISLCHLEPPILSGPGEHGLDIETLANAFLVIRGDPVRRGGLDVVDPERPLHWHFARHG